MNTNNRIFFALSFCLLCLFSCKKDNGNGGEIPGLTKPNILLIIADDLGLDATPGYDLGTIKPNMPNLQKLMDEGLRFNNLWANSTCTPTRSSILTGKYGFRTGVTQVGDVLSTTETSLHSYLATQASDYNSAVIGKWHLGDNRSHPNSMGVSHYAGVLSGGVNSYTNWNLTENGVNSNSTEYVTSKISDLAIDWLGQQEEPWFLWLAYNAPHTPFHLPPSHLHNQGSLADDQATIDANPLPYYMAAIEAMDTEMGRVLSSLSEEELANTIILFIGDNGTPGQVAQDYNTNRVKGTVYQGGVNVPLIVSGKGVSRINQTEEALINTTDLFATIAAIAGVENADQNDSQSFKELLTNASSDSRDYVYAEQGNDLGGSNYTIRNATHKYIQFDNGSEALYNLQQNPLEIPNLLNVNQLPLSEADSLIKEELLTKLIEIRE